MPLEGPPEVGHLGVGPLRGSLYAPCVAMTESWLRTTCRRPPDPSRFRAPRGNILPFEKSHAMSGQTGLPDSPEITLKHGCDSVPPISPWEGRISSCAPKALKGGYKIARAVAPGIDNSQFLALKVRASIPEPTPIKNPKRNLCNPINPGNTAKAPV